MLQQFLLLLLMSDMQQPADSACVVHIPDLDVAHVPEADIDPWLDPATAELVTTPRPRIERRLNNQGVKIDIDIPEGLVDGPEAYCR